MNSEPAPGERPGRQPLHIDAHQHFWRYDPADYPWIDETMTPLRRDFLPDHLRPELASAGVGATVAVQATQTMAETRWLLGLAESSDFIAGVVGWVDLQAEAVERDISALAGHPKLVGLRHIVQSEPEDRFLLRPSFCRGIATLPQFGLTYDILIYPRHLPVAAEFVSRFDRQPFVLDHLAKPEIRRAAMDPWARDLERLAQAPNVWCKVSGLVTEADWHRWHHEDIHPYLDVAFACFGPDRLIAGSDWPVCTLAAGYSRTMRVVGDYLQGRPAAERDAVLGVNAARFYRLRPPKRRERQRPVDERRA
jgi:L-fuconolactonase